jgi:phytanoyl-CoA hydroxylase
MALEAPVITPAERRSYDEGGYLVARGLFAPAEVAAMLDVFAGLHARRCVDGCFEAAPSTPDADPLDVYPRMMHPHRVSDEVRGWMLHPPLAPILRELLGEEPIAAQSMFYWKPPGGRGQAPHQDNYYLRTAPTTCLAAWLALDPADRDNGGLFVAPGSHKLPVYCPEEADLSVSFASEYVPVPRGLREQPVDLAPGDVLFFGGNLIHGSQPNRTADRFRRSFICHYVGASATEISWYYQPLYRFDGTQLALAEASGGGPCGDAPIAGPH